MSLPVQDTRQNIINELHPGSKIDPVHATELTKPKYPIIETARVYSGFSSLGLGTQNIQYNIQQNLIPKQIIVAMKLKGSATAAVCAAAAYAMIKKIDYRIGGSTVFSETGFSNFQWAQHQLKSNEAVQYLYTLAGGDGAAVSADGRWVYAVLTLPFSRFLVTQHRYGIDTSLLKQPISIFISLATNAQVYTADTSIDTLLAGNFQVVASEYVNSSDRYIPPMGKFLSLPTRYVYEYTTSDFTPPGPTALQTVNLQSFRSGNLLGMIICAQDVADIETVNAFRLNTIKNLKISFNNQVLYQSLEESYKLIDLNDHFGATTYLTAYGKQNYGIFVKFTERKFNSTGHNQSLGLSLGSQTLTADFYISDSTNRQVLKCIYVYDSLIIYNETNQEMLV
jgi:hypothetical protein